MQNLRNTAYWGIFESVWTFFKSHLPPPDVDDSEAWDEITGEIGKLMDAFRPLPQGPFAVALFVSVLDEFDRLARTTSKERQIEVNGDEQHGTSAEIPRSAAILDDGGASEGGREDRESDIGNDQETSEAQISR